MLGQIVSKGLSGMGRMLKISVLLKDKPGALKELVDEISSINVNIVEVIPDNPFETICPKRYMSIFPPHSMGTTFFPDSGLCFRIYAKATAPAGSTTAFDLSIKRNMAFIISLSSTVTISSIFCLLLILIIGECVSFCKW